MSEFQLLIMSLWGVYAAIGGVIGVRQVKRRNSHGLCIPFNPIGAFVWTDAVVFGIFFLGISIVCILLQDFVLFLLILSVFWTVRSIGEQMYWFLEQFTSYHKNPPQTLWTHKFFKGEQTWIVMQIFWQCISVISIIATVYLFSLWFK